MSHIQAPRKQILIAGGDLRQVTAAECLAADYAVSVIGFDRFGTLPAGIAAAEHISALPKEIDALILPMPVTQDGLFLHTPFGSSALPLSTLLPLVRPGGAVLGGRLLERERAMIQAAGLHAGDYAAEETFALRNAVPTAEGAIQIAMQELPVVLHGLPCLILGAGRVSRALQPRLRALGADVTVAARRCIDLARSEGGVRKPAAQSADNLVYRILPLYRDLHPEEDVVKATDLPLKKTRIGSIQRITRKPGISPSFCIFILQIIRVYAGRAAQQAYRADTPTKSPARVRRIRPS